MRNRASLASSLTTPEPTVPKPRIPTVILLICCLTPSLREYHKAVGGRQWAAGSGQQAVGSRQWAAGSGHQAAGGRQREAGGGEQAGGGRQWAAGSGRQAVGSRQLDLNFDNLHTRA